MLTKGKCNISYKRKGRFSYSAHLTQIRHYTVKMINNFKLCTIDWTPEGLILSLFVLLSKVFVIWRGIPQRSPSEQTTANTVVALNTHLLPRWVSIEVGDNIASYCKLVLTDKTLMFQPSPFGSNQLLHWNGAGYKTTNYWCCMRLSSDASTATVDVAQWAKK